MSLGRFALVVSCEHASRACPPEFDTSGIDPEVFETHAAWDPIAPEVAQAVAKAFSAPLFLGRWTRLFCDLNRSPDAPDAVPGLAFGVVVPSNAALDARARAARIEAHHAPHWNGVRNAITAGLERAPVLHLSVHSFVESYQGRFREVDLGVLVDPVTPLEGPISKLLVERLRGERPYLVRENEPYDGRADGLTTGMRREFPADRYAGVEIEISQRHMSGGAAVGKVLIAALRDLVI